MRSTGPRAPHGSPRADRRYMSLNTLSSAYHPGRLSGETERKLGCIVGEIDSGFAARDQGLKEQLLGNEVFLAAVERRHLRPGFLNDSNEASLQQNVA